MKTPIKITKAHTLNFEIPLLRMYPTDIFIHGKNEIHTKLGFSELFTIEKDKNIPIVYLYGAGSRNHNTFMQCNAMQA